MRKLSFLVLVTVMALSLVMVPSYQAAEAQDGLSLIHI